MDIEKIMSGCLIFLLGLASMSFLNYFIFSETENPVLTNLGIVDNNSRQAPSDFLKENQIEVYEDRVIINVKKASISRYAPTGSMIPLLNENSNGIRIKPESENDINKGDIITFEQNGDLIIHRVIDIGKDSEGVYFITKGDNNSISDGKIRFKDIKYKTIGILW